MSFSKPLTLFCDVLAPKRVKGVREMEFKILMTSDCWRHKFFNTKIKQKPF